MAYNQLLAGAQTLLTDLMAQAVNLVVMEVRESDNTTIKKQHASLPEPHGSPITVRALKSSIILLQFSVVEALASFVSKLVIEAHRHPSEGPRAPHPLREVELDCLNEQRTSVDTRSGKIHVKGNVYAPTLERLSFVLLSFAKSHGHEFRLNKSNDGWQNVTRLKKLRDELTHVRLDFSLGTLIELETLDLDKIRPSITITNRNLFMGAEAIIWYSQQIRHVVNQSTNHDYRQVVHLLTVVEFLAYMQLLNLHKSCGISSKAFEKSHPIPIKFLRNQARKQRPE